MNKPNLNATPPWLDPGTFVRRVDDGRRGIVIDVEETYVGTLHSVRLLDGSVCELLREHVAVTPVDVELEGLARPRRTLSVWEWLRAPAV